MSFVLSSLSEGFVVVDYGHWSLLDFPYFGYCGYDC